MSFNKQLFSLMLSTFLLYGCSIGSDPTKYSLPSEDLITISEYPSYESPITWPILSQLRQPDGLRPCCAFGYNLKVEMFGISVPFYQIDNIVESDKLGTHSYNDSIFKSAAVVMGISSEKVGLTYSKYGGFIDLAHIRDTIDNTLYLFSHLYSKLGNDTVIDLGNDELLDRKIVLFNKNIPLSDIERYNFAAYLSAKLAYEMAVWHEIAQWYGYRSVFFVSEQISAFSPEDLYSNLLGARIALELILHGYAQDHQQFNQAVTIVLPNILEQLGAGDKSESKRAFDYINGVWWDSHKRVPQASLVLHRNYDTDNYLIPSYLSSLNNPVQALGLSEFYRQYKLSDFGQLQLWPTKKHGLLLQVDKPYLTRDDFKMLAEKAKQEEKQIIK